MSTLNLNEIDTLIVAEDIKMKPTHKSKSEGLTKADKKRERDFRRGRKSARGRQWQQGE